MRRRQGALILLLTLAGTAAPRPVPGQDGAAIGFRNYELEVGGKVTEVLPHDLDGDGRLDLVVVRGREALIYLQEPDGTWPSRPNQRFRFHPDTILFDVGDLEGDGSAELVLLMADGLQAYSLRSRPGGRSLYGLRPRPLVQVAGFLSRPVEDEVRRKELLRDLDGDGALDLLVPQRDGFAAIRNLGGGRLAAPVPLQLPPEAALHPGWDRLSSRLFASYWFPNPLPAQWDGGGPPELVAAREGTLELFRIEPRDAGFLVTRLPGQVVPDQKQLTFAVENPFELDFTMPLVLRDLNHDGRLDVSSTHVGQGTTRVYFNGEDPAKALATPTASIRAKGVTLISFYADLDGDGRDDLILPRMDKIGVWSILKVLITRSVPVEVLFFFQRDRAPWFPEDPDAVRELEVPVALHGKGEDGLQLGSSLVANVGDFDGDGKLDLLNRTGPTRISFYRGLGRRFAESPSGEATVPDVEAHRFCLAEVHDLNGDGRADVVLRYFSWDKKSDRITLLISQGPSSR